MNVNCKISLTDEERNRLAKVIDGKVSKRLATRADVNAFVKGIVDYAVSQAGTPAEPDNPSYMRGWNEVGNRLRNGTLRSPRS